MDRKGNQHEQDDLRISEMILASLEGTIKPEEFEDLQKRIRTEPRVAEMYVDFVLNHAIVVQRKERHGRVGDGLAILERACRDGKNFADGRGSFGV
jgi:hypothetical protein